MTEVSRGRFGLVEYTFLEAEVRHRVRVWVLRWGADTIVKETCCARMGQRRVTR